MGSITSALSVKLTNRRFRIQFYVSSKEDSYDGTGDQTYTWVPAVYCRDLYKE